MPSSFYFYLSKTVDIISFRWKYFHIFFKNVTSFVEIDFYFEYGAINNYLDGYDFDRVRFFVSLQIQLINVKQLSL
jgi:hypothetical protein